MIAAIDPKEYVPYGRGHSRRHPHRRPPGAAVPPAASPSCDAAADSADGNATEPPPDSARWRVHLCPSGGDGDESVVEELYIDGSVLVCSRGPGRYKCFSLGQPVVDAVRCQYTWSASAHVLSERQPPPAEQKPRSSLMSAVCCVTSESVQSWTDSGEHFITPLPFQVSEMWSMKEGLLLRRRVTGEDRLPILFSVLHPLDDTAPVLIRSGVSNVGGGDLGQVTRPEVTVVCVSRHPSLCVTHDSSTGQHTIWKLRRTTAEEWWHADEPVSAAADVTVAGTPLSAVAAGGASCVVSPAAAVGVSQLRSEPVSPWSRNASRISGGASLHTVGASLSRSQSPSVSIGTACYLRLCASPSPARALSSSLSAAAAVQPPAAAIQPLNSSCAATSNVAHTPVTGVVGGAGGSANTSSCQRARAGDGTVDDGTSTETSGEPPRPDICLQRLWRDNVTFSVAASGGFVTCDLSGVSYVVLVLAARSRLRLIRYERGNSDAPDICGLVSMVPGRDALPIPGSGTMLVVQSVGTLLLYSGLQRLCKVHVPGVPAPSLCHSLLQSAVASMPLSLQGSPFCPPRRSSLLPGVLSSFATGIGGASIASAGGATGSSRSGLEARLDDALSLLSPVRAELESVHQQQLRSTNASSSTWTETTVHEESAIPLSASLCSLKAVFGDTVIMEHSSGCLYSFRVPRPAAAASVVVSAGGGADTALYTTGAVVDACAVALRAVLPREPAHQLTTRWFCAEHAPGARPESPAARWKLFSVTLLQMLGYSVETLSIARFLDVHSAELDSQHFTKRCKVDDAGDEDWEYLLSSDFHRAITGNCSVAEHADVTSFSHHHHHHQMSSDGTHRLDSSSINSTVHATSTLSPHISAVLFALHLVYEDCKLNTLHVDVLPSMARVLHFLACQLSWTPYIVHCRRDMPELSTSTDPSLSKQDARPQQRSPLSLPVDPPDVMHAISGRVASPQYPYLADVNTLSANMIAVFSVLRTGRCSSSTLMGSLLSHVTGPVPAALQTALRHVISLRCHSRAHAAVWLLVTLGYERRQLQQLPGQLRLPLLHALLAVRASPPSDASADFYRLIGREERAADGTLPPSSGHQQPAPLPLPDPTAATSIPGSATGASTSQPSSAAADSAGADCEPLCAEVDRLLWPADHRLEEASRQLHTQLPVTVQLSEPRPELNEHELQELHRRHLLTLTQRTMAIPIGRGMLELHSSAAVVTECLPVSQLCLSGRAPPRGTSVELTDAELPAVSTVWPLFHNGVAAGLRVHPNAQHLDAAWILYNRPKSGSLTSGESSVEHAGVLMALGLCGHLQKLAKLNVHDYLIKGHDVTSLGVLLGLAACKRGTMDLDTIKLLSIHVESLLPPTSRELDIPHSVQVAAVLGVGLVYQGSNNRHMAEVLLREIARPPGPEMENCADRESYALAAGLGLGMVTLGHGHDPHGISSQLHQLVFGGNKPPLPGPQKERYKAASFHIREGDVVNTDVTAAGATLALALMYLDSDNQAVADWLRVPETAYLLDMVRPDLLQLRVLARCLILWRHIRPTRQWVELNLPAIVWRHMLTSSHEPHVDYQTMSQVCYYVLSGACLALGLRYAGTADPEARQLLLSFTHELMSEDACVASEESGRATMENALCVTLTALAMVMSGTGDLETMRVCRYLRSRGSGGTAPGSPVNYGSHMAVHMSLGLLFLGGGRQAVSNSPSAVAALLCAFFPRYPANSCDNRYHLQALRHMYVLAAEPRLLIPRDVDTGRLVYCHLAVTRETTDQHSVDPVTLIEPVHRGVVRAPCLLPRLDTIQEIRVQDDLFWAFTVAPSVHGYSLSELLKTFGGILAVKRKSGAALQRDHLATFISQQLNSCRYKQLSWWPQFATSSGCGEFASLADGGEYAQLCRYFLPIDGSTGGSCQAQLAALLGSCIAAERTQLFLPTAARLLELSKSRDDDGDERMRTDGCLNDGCRGEEDNDEPSGNDGKDPECVFDGLSRQMSDLDPMQRAAEACRRSGVLFSLPSFLQSSPKTAVSSAS